ncbi:MAG: hypothetical protein R2824_12630 [Saprospiraceae bacterium]
MTIGESEEVAFTIEEALGYQGIGARSIKNYTHYIQDQSYDRINPNLSTLNSLVQYLWEADNANGLWLKFRKRTKATKNSFFGEHKKKMLLVVLLLACLLAGGLTYSFQKRPFKAYRYTFTDSNLDRLEKEGWFLFPDSINLDLWNDPSIQSSPLLNLKTHPGGSWLENRNYTPKTINTLTHPIQCGECCEILVKLVDFNPYQRYQQAGFFLFYGDSEIPSIHFAHASAGRESHIQAVKRNGLYANEHLLPFEQYKKRSKVSDIVLNPTNHRFEPKTTVDSTVLKLVIQGSHYFFLYKTDQNDYTPVGSKKIEFGSPSYIGLTAFQGRPDVPYPVFPTASVIDAKFEYVVVKKCE